MFAIRFFLFFAFSLSCFQELGAQRMNRYDEQGKKHGLWKDSVKISTYEYYVGKGVYEHGQKSGEWTERRGLSYGRNFSKGGYTNGKRNGWWMDLYKRSDTVTQIGAKWNYRNDTVLEYISYATPAYNQPEITMVHHRCYVCPTGDTVSSETYYCGTLSDSGKLKEKINWTDYGAQALRLYPGRPSGALRMTQKEYYHSGRLHAFVDSIYLQNRVVINEYAENGRLKQSETVTGPFGFRYNQWWGDASSPGYYFFEDGRRIKQDVPDSLHPVVREGTEYPGYDSTLSCHWVETQVGYLYTRTTVCMSGGNIRSTARWSQNVETGFSASRSVGYYPSGRLSGCGSAGADTSFYENGRIARIDRHDQEGTSQVEYYPDGKLKFVWENRNGELRRERYDAEGNRVEY